jgi:hypothetical protein
MTAVSSFIRTITVGSGLSPDLLTPFRKGRGARGLPRMTWDTAGGELHPALRISALTIKNTAGGVNTFQEWWRKIHRYGYGALLRFF